MLCCKFLSLSSPLPSSFCLSHPQDYHHLSLSCVINHLFSLSLWYCILLIIIISLFPSFSSDYCIHAFSLSFVIKFDQENNHYRWQSLSPFFGIEYSAVKLKKKQICGPMQSTNQMLIDDKFITHQK